MKKAVILIAAILLSITAYYLYSSQIFEKKSAHIEKIRDIPSRISKAGKEGIGSGKFINARVTKVTDGDTFEVEYKDETLKVRFICVDTPESVKEGVAVQEYSKEAAAYTRSQVENQQVKLIFEKDLTDNYGRFLAHVILKDGTYLNATLVRNGFARVESVSPNTASAAFFNDLQEKAISEKAGLWGLSRSKVPFVKDQNGKYVPRYRK